MNMKDNNREKKVSLLQEKKLIIFSRYLSITEKMKQAIKPDNLADKQSDNLADNLAELGSQRQVCIKKIDKINLSMNRVTAAEYDEFSTDDSHPRQLKSIMETIDSMDRELMIMAEQESGSIKTLLLQKHNNRQAVQGYTHGSTLGYNRGRKYSPRFLDTKS